MKAVNLLPARHRPRAPTGRAQGSAYILVGALGVVLLALVAYVFTANQVIDRQAELAETTQKADEAEARANALSGFTKFAEVKEVRESSVKALAGARVDWERLVREMARVLPREVTLKSIDASASGSSSSGSSSSGASPAASSPSSTTGASAEPSGPTVSLEGCAPTQPTVATTLVRLRGLYGAKDVQLKSSIRGAEGEGGAAGAGGAGAAGGGGASGCPTSGAGRPQYAFSATVMLDAPKPASAAQRDVPASLGGGR